MGVVSEILAKRKTTEMQSALISFLITVIRPNTCAAAAAPAAAPAAAVYGLFQIYVGTSAGDFQRMESWTRN